MKSDRVNHFCALVFLFLIFFEGLSAAPQGAADIREKLFNLQHELSNQATELRMFEERVDNQETIIANLRQQVQNATQTNRELLKSNSNSFENKIDTLDTSNKGLIADLQQLKTHANDTVAALAKCQQRLQELEQSAAQQNQNIVHLQSALQGIVEALGVKDNQKSYQIKSGDSLEKIAKAHSTTIKAIKELNQMTNDKIVVGRTIQIP